MTRRIDGLDPHPSPARIRELFRQKTGRDVEAIDGVITIGALAEGQRIRFRCATHEDEDRLYAAMSEHEHQVELFAWAEQQTHRWWELALLFAIPNFKGLGQKGVGGKLKAEGRKRGVPDICLPVPRAQFHGLYIELKRIGGKPDERQLEWRAQLRAQGYRAEIVEGWHAARDLLVRYLES